MPRVHIVYRIMQAKATGGPTQPPNKILSVCSLKGHFSDCMTKQNKNNTLDWDHYVSDSTIIQVIDTYISYFSRLYAPGAVINGKFLTRLKLAENLSGMSACPNKLKASGFMLDMIVVISFLLSLRSQHFPVLEKLLAITLTLPVSTAD